MKRAPKLYISLETEAGLLIVDGPLELLDQLILTLSGQGGQWRRVAELASEPQEPPAGDDGARRNDTGCTGTECTGTECTGTGC